MERKLRDASAGAGMKRLRLRHADTNEGPPNWLTALFDMNLAGVIWAAMKLNLL